MKLAYPIKPMGKATLKKLLKRAVKAERAVGKETAKEQRKLLNLK